MIYLEKQSTDPYYNIAAEEIALKSRNEDILMLWINDESIVVGKHQNTIAEVNQNYVSKHDIPVIRRLSGGGTVYHDNGNINYSVITTVENKERSIDFQKFTDPIVKFLEKHGHRATFHGKTNLGINGQKFSGNAAHIFRNRVIHHGTILFNSDLNKLEQSIMPNKADVNDKSIKSVRANIVNLINLIPEINTIVDFKEHLKQFLFDYYTIVNSQVFSTNEQAEIRELVENKYNKPEWNYGYSPTYQYKKTEVFCGENITIWLEVKKGIIVDLQLNSSIIPDDLITLIRNSIINKLHHPDMMHENLKQINNQLSTIDMDVNFIVNLLF